MTETTKARLKLAGIVVGLVAGLWAGGVYLGLVGMPKSDVVIAPISVARGGGAGAEAGGVIRFSNGTTAEIAGIKEWAWEKDLASDKWWAADGTLIGRPAEAQTRELMLRANGRKIRVVMRWHVAAGSEFGPMVSFIGDTGGSAGSASTVRTLPGGDSILDWDAMVGTGAKALTMEVGLAVGEWRVDSSLDLNDLAGSQHESNSGGMKITEVKEAGGKCEVKMTGREKAWANRTTRVVWVGKGGVEVFPNSTSVEARPDGSRMSSYTFETTRAEGARLEFRSRGVETVRVERVALAPKGK